MSIRLEVSEEQLEYYKQLALDHLYYCEALLKIEEHFRTGFYGVSLSYNGRRDWFTGVITIHSDYALSFGSQKEAIEYVQEVILPNIGLAVQKERLDLVPANG